MMIQRRLLPLFGLMVLVCAVPALGGAGKPQPAQTVLDDALKTAKASHKNVLVIFHASWCGWCRRLNTMLSQPDIAKIFNANYVRVDLDVLENKDKKDILENPGGQKIMADLGGEKSGLPFYAFLDEKGKKIADSNVMPKNQNIGYPGAPDEIVAFAKLLEKSAPKMSAADREVVVAYLKKNAPPSSGSSGG